LLTQQIVPIMKRTGGGTIVNINSMAAHSPSAGESVYAASKGGLDSFSEALNQEFAEWHIQTISVQLGAMATAMQILRTDLEKCINPDDAAQVIYELATAERRSLRITEIEIKRARY